MRIFTTLPQENLATVGAAAQTIEATGYTGVSTQENRHEPFLSLAVAGAATKRIELHTGVAIAFARSPMAVANVGWDLASSFGGTRVTLGIGSQVRAHNERRFSVPWTPPRRASASTCRPCGDLGGMEGRRQAQLRGQALPLHADDAQLRARAL